MRFIFTLTGVVVWIAVIIFIVQLLRQRNNSLYKSSTNKMICGVCGGIGEYFNIDPTVIRIIWAIVTICGGSGILAYIIAAIIMKERP